MFFDMEGDPLFDGGLAEAVDRAGHLADFWEPRMRAQYLAYVAEGGKGLDPVAIAAAGLMKPVAA